MSDDYRAKFRQLKNAIEMLRQVEHFEMDYEVSVLEDIVEDGRRVVNNATELLDAVRAAHVSSVESLLSE